MSDTFIRVIVQTSDANMAANVGGHVSQEFRTFDIEAPILVAYLRERFKGLINRSVVGIEIAAPATTEGGPRDGE